MKNWPQILVFVLLSLVLGFILGRVTSKERHELHKEKRIIKMDGGVEGHHRGMSGHEIDSDMTMEFHGDDEIGAVVKRIEESDFNGDTTIQIDGATISIMRDGDELQVEVETEVDGDGRQEKKMRIEREIIKD